MILSGLKIDSEVKAGNILLDPYDTSRLGPNSYNLRLANELVMYEPGMLLDMKDDNPVIRTEIPASGYTLVPGTVYLCRTVERTFTQKYVPMIEGRSSVGRLGLFIHSTAGFGDVGFNGFWTLELSVVQPLKIYAGVEIAQIYYHTLEGAAAFKYKGKYQSNYGVQSSQLWRDF